jgi:6-phosphogluconolactonase
MQHSPAVVVAPREVLAARFATLCAGAMREAIAMRGRFALAVPGGSVTAELLPAFAAADLEWDSLDLLFTDERCVPPESGDSNFNAVSRSFLSRLRAGSPRVHRMEGERLDLASAASEYAEALRSLLGTPPVLDLALLGVGEDGHVASLFPGHATLHDESGLVLLEDAAPNPPARRLTLSLAVLARARQVVVGAFGPAKSRVIGGALGDARSTLPLALLLRATRRATVLLDEAAMPPEVSAKSRA